MRARIVQNIAGGAAVVVRLRGREFDCLAEIMEDKAILERGLGAFLRKHPSTARR